MTRRFGVVCILVLLSAAAAACTCPSPCHTPCKCRPATPCDWHHWQSWRIEVLLTRARMQLDAGKVDDARESCAKAQEIGLWDARIMGLLGEVNLRERNWTEAVIALRQATDSAADKKLLAEALTSAGWERDGWGMPGDAMRLWAEAVENDPSNGWAQASLGMAYLRQGDLERAEVSCRRATEFEPAWVGGWLHLGLVLYVKEDLAGARDSTRKALELSPDDPVAAGNLAFVLFDLGETEEAIALWAKSVEVDRSAVDSRAGLAIGLWRAGKTAEALQAYKEAIARDDSYREVELLVSEHFWSQNAAKVAGEVIEALAAE